MKILLALLLVSFGAHAAPTTPKAAPSAVRVYDANTSNSSKQEPSSVPCPPQKTRTDKLDDLAKLQGEGESHSTNCPAQGTIKDTPEKATF